MVNRKTFQHTRQYTICVKNKTPSKPNIFYAKKCTILQTYTAHSTHPTQ